ncbi:MAG: DUF1080 domain-containing protein [Bryobacteraceae bacterium]
MRATHLALFLAAALAPAACAQALNTLTPAERRDGWILLFDGRSFNGWVDPNLKDPPAHAWEVADGCLKTVPHAATREDLMSARKFRDFEMVFDWKVAPGANSGVKYRIQALVFMDADKLRHGVPYEQQVEFEYENHPPDRRSVRPGGRYEEYPVAFEYQVIDSARHPDALRGAKYRAAALYGMSPVTSFQDHPQGEWNSSRIVLRGKHVEHWLNGVQVVDTSLDAPEVRQAIENRWREAPGIRKLLLDQPVAESPIALQHHVDAAWYRNIKIRPLD